MVERSSVVRVNVLRHILISEWGQGGDTEEVAMKGTGYPK